MSTKSLLFMALGLIMFSQVSFSQENVENKKEENKKIELKPYGFVKGDMVYSNASVTSFGASNLGAPQIVSSTGNDQSALGFTAQHTRFGLKGSVGEKIKAGGVIELDFYGGAFDANIKPRIRLAYASVTAGGFEARMGQQWDIFSPNNANTNNTNANMWYAGNRGFRRAQLQLSYKISNKVFAPMVQVSLAEATKEESGLGKDNISGMPMFQARVSGKIMEKYEIGLSYVNATYTELENTIEATSNTTTNPIKDTLKSDFNFKTSGIGVDFNLPFHKYFSLLGEFNTGKNLNDANLFNIAGNHSWKIVGGDVVKNDKKSMGLWFNATSNITSWLNVVVGYGCDKNTSDDLVEGNIARNRVVYGDLVFPIKHGFSFALEYQYITTNKITVLDTDGDIAHTDRFTAGIINLSAKITF
ncbi:MAG: hypothetical protein A2041_03165 [Bacteroidetes bacterium GWA2_31_9b]|nr:MAG: hypothetical protein A2041_03165 [Bacteroidetes bacterium GWA2_31_9b]